MNFDNTKKQVLQKLQQCDKSPKGSLDEPIVGLVFYLNERPEYVTTSSCSGRISVFCYQDKKGGQWIVSSHDAVPGSLAEELPERVKAYPNHRILFKVLCRDMESAERLLRTAINVGYRESGMVPRTSALSYPLPAVHKMMVAIRTTSHSIEVPIAAGGALLVSLDYLHYLIPYANELLQGNLRKIETLHREEWEEAMLQCCFVSKTIRVSPRVKPMEQFFQMVISFLGDDLDLREKILVTLPFHFEFVGDIFVIGKGQLPESVWDAVPQCYEWISECWGVRRVARYQEVNPDIKRESRTGIVYPPDCQDGWVMVKQHGIKYHFDISKVMFSSGNVTERKRMGEVPCEGEVIFDLYAGIGYFTIPLLVFGHPNRVYACDINPNSVEALKRNLEENGVAEKCTVLLGDNADTTSAYRDLCDRVLLGLLPSSRNGWEIAGGILYIHENVKQSQIEEFQVETANTIAQLGRDQGKPWNVSVEHLEIVKSYAPRVYHIVLDVKCSAA